MDIVTLSFEECARWGHRKGSIGVWLANRLWLMLLWFSGSMKGEWYRVACDTRAYAVYLGKALNCIWYVRVVVLEPAFTFVRALCITFLRADANTAAARNR